MYSELEDAILAVENAIVKCLPELDADEALDVGQHVLGRTHPLVVALKKQIDKFDAELLR